VEYIAIYSLVSFQKILKLRNMTFKKTTTGSLVRGVTKYPLRGLPSNASSLYG
jgi:hypothetical protein